MALLIVQKSPKLANHRAGPSETAKAAVRAGVAVAVSAVAGDVMASGGSVINRFKTSRYA